MIGYILIFIGLFFIFSAVIGCYRLPDYFCKMHAASVGDVVGCPLVLIGIALKAGSAILSFKIIGLALVLLVINPTASYLLNKLALKQGLSPKENNND
jgi:multicomponent Na+:H+ antiporter subunit G